MTETDDRRRSFLEKGDEKHEMGIIWGLGFGLGVRGKEKDERNRGNGGLSLLFILLHCSQFYSTALSAIVPCIVGISP